MLFGKGKFYSIFTDSNSETPLDDIEIVSNGFNFWAFIITPIWAVFNRCWLLAFIVVMCEVFAGVASQMGYLSALQAKVILAIFYLYCGLEAANFKEIALKKRGYVMHDIVYARDENSAKVRFMDKYILNQTQANHQPPKKKIFDEFIFDNPPDSSSNSKSFA